MTPSSPSSLIPGEGSFSTISLLLAMLILALGLIVVLNHRRRPASWYFILLCGALFFWYSISAVPRRWSSLVGLGVLTWAPVFLYSFLRTWLDRTKEQGVFSQIPRLLYLFPLVACLSFLYAPNLEPATLQAIRIPIQLTLVAGFVLGFSPLFHSFRSSLSRVERWRLLYLLGTGIVAVIFTALDFVSGGTPAVGNILTFGYLWILFETLKRDRLLDLNELIGTILVPSLFVVVLAPLALILDAAGGNLRQSMTLVAGLTLLTYDPLRPYLERFLYSWIYPERIQLAQHLSELRKSLSNTIDRREAVRKTLAVFEGTQRMTHASIYIVDSEGSYELASHIGPRPVERLAAATRRPLLNLLLSTKKPVTLEHLSRERQRLLLIRAGTNELETLDEAARTLVELHAGVVLGIFATSGDLLNEGDDTQLVRLLPGLLCIKDERVSEAFTPEELEALQSIAGQLGITLQNSRDYERFRERDRLAALGEMAAGLAHEIRNPLGAIKGAAELILPQPGEPLSEDAGEFLGIIIEETRRLNKVVSQFLEYARHYKGDFSAIQVNEVVQKTLALLPAAEAGVRLELDLQEVPVLSGDAEQLRQVFLNLGRNAIEAMEGGGVLRVSSALRKGPLTLPTSPHIEIRFTDTGPGIPQGKKRSIFVPFVTTKTKGTGLGLPISQRIIENHGGFIEVHSREGEGATFVVVLPVTQQGEARAALPSQPSQTV